MNGQRANDNIQLSAEDQFETMVPPGEDGVRMSNTERNAIAEADEWLKHNRLVPHEKVLTELGLTMDDWAKIGRVRCLGRAAKMVSDFSPLEERERNSLERRLEHPFPGRDELRLRMSSIAGKVIDTYGSLELPVPVVHVAPVIQNVPVEAEYFDTDGVPVWVLHVVRGFLMGLEIIGGPAPDRIFPFSKDYEEITRRNGPGPHFP